MMQPDDLERSTQRRLSQLPTPKAPRTLLPQVMSAVQIASARPWYARRWLAWPAGWQVASMAALVALVCSAVVGLSALREELVTAVLAGIQRTVPAGSVLIELARSASTDAVIGSWSLVDVTAGVVVPLFLTMLAVSTVLGAALCRVARGGAFQ